MLIANILDDIKSHGTVIYNSKEKISSIRDWRSTPTYCQLQSHV